MLLFVAVLAAQTPYPELRESVQEARRALPSEATSQEVEALFVRSLRDTLMPPWFGTPWDFYGTTEVPGEGEIACGYFVTTLLRDMGVKLRRVHLAQQASETIIKTLVPAKEIKRFSNRSVDEVIDHVEKQGAGVYLVGLDYHVAFLVNQNEKTEMCHSSVLAPGSVVCEDARKAEAMKSGYHVVGELTNARLLKAWRN